MSVSNQSNANVHGLEIRKYANVWTVDCRQEPAFVHDYEEAISRRFFSPKFVISIFTFPSKYTKITLTIISIFLNYRRLEKIAVVNIEEIGDDSKKH